MKHLVVLYYVLSFGSGLVGIVLSVVLYLKTRMKALIGFTAFVVLLFALVLSNSLYFYIFRIIGYLSTDIEIVFSIVFFVCFGGMIYLMPYLLHQMIGKKFEGVKNIVFMAFGLLPVIFIILPPFIAGDDKAILSIYWFELYSVYIYLFYAVIVYTIIGMLLNLQADRLSPFVRKILLTVFVLAIIFFPAFIIDGFWKFFQLNLKFLPRFVTLTPIFFFLWNVFITIFGAGFLIYNDRMLKSFKDIPNSFIQVYQISDREKQVLELNIQGLSHQKIGDKLFISAGTVRNYIYGIYQRTGVNNRLSLIEMMQRMG